MFTRTLSVQGAGKFLLLRAASNSFLDESNEEATPGELTRMAV